MYEWSLMSCLSPIKDILKMAVRIWITDTPISLLKSVSNKSWFFLTAVLSPKAIRSLFYAMSKRTPSLDCTEEGTVASTNGPLEPK